MTTPLTDPVAAPGPLRRVGRLADALLENLSAALMLMAALVAVMQVFYRYVLNASLSWPEEVALWAFVWGVFIGLAVAVGRDGHISITLLRRLLPDAALSWHRLFVQSMTAAACVVLVVHGQDFMGRVMSASPALQMPLRYLYMAVPVGGGLALVYVALTGDALRVWAGPLAVVLGVLVYLAARHGAGLVLDHRSAATVLMLVALALILLDVPIAFSLAFAAFAAFAPQGNLMLVIVAQNMASALNSFTLLAIPFFIMAAAVMNAGGITTRLIDLATHLVGHFRGGLGQANVLTNTLMAGVSGSSTADASAIAKLMVPEMEKRGYDRAFGCALTSAASTLANLIPPSLGLIIYAAVASVSVGALFVATIVPGLIVAAVLALLVYLISRVKGYGAGRARSSGRQRLGALWVAVPALLLPVAVVGGVRFGVFTATEAGSMAVVFAIVCGVFFYRQLTADGFVRAVRDAAGDTVAVAVIIAAAAPFAWVLTAEQMPQRIAAGITGQGMSPEMVLLMVLLFLLVIGLFMEMIAAMVILVPILLPVVVAAGLHPVQFGVVLVLSLVIGALTPPLGVLVFTTARVGQAEVVAVFRAVLPFVGAMICVLLAVTFLPGLTMGLTRWLGP